MAFRQQQCFREGTYEVGGLSCDMLCQTFSVVLIYIINIYYNMSIAEYWCVFVFPINHQTPRN